MPTKKLLERSAPAIAILLTILVAVASLVSFKSTGQLLDFHFKNQDKLGHFIAYFMLATSWFFSAPRFRLRTFTVIWAIILYGIILEGLQEILTTNRTADIMDVLANSAGVFLAALLFTRLGKLQPIKKNLSN